MAKSKHSRNTGWTDTWMYVARDAWMAAWTDRRMDCPNNHMDIYECCWRIYFTRITF